MEHRFLSDKTYLIRSNKVDIIDRNCWKMLTKSRTIKMPVNPMKSLKMLPLDILHIPALRILVPSDKTASNRNDFSIECRDVAEKSFCVTISAHFGEIKLEGSVGLLRANPFDAA